LRLVEDEAILDGAKAAAEPIRVARVMVSFMVFWFVVKVDIMFRIMRLS
jgi:hypothetical protein